MTEFVDVICRKTWETLLEWEIHIWFLIFWLQDELNLS